MPSRNPYVPDDYVYSPSKDPVEPGAPASTYDGGGSRPRPMPEQPWVPPPGYPPRPRVVEIPARDLSLSSTVLDQVVPVVYGSHIATGRVAAYEYTAASRTLKLGIVFSLGEQDTISNVRINGELTSDATWATASTHVGDGTTALSSILTGMTNWTTDDTTLWKTLCHVALSIDCRSGEAPANLTVTAELGGRVITDFRDSSTDAYTNPVLVAYDVMTSDDWRGLAASRVDAGATGTWADVANWCDETMSDASARYSFNGVIAEREPDAAMAMVLGHCLAFPYIANDGTVCLWAEMSPPPITGEWSATASATITEDSTAGAATTELSVGDRVYVGTYLRQVSSITDDDTVVLDSAVTVSGVSVRPITGLYIESSDWAAWPSAQEASILETPDKIRARFEDGTNHGSHEVTTTYGSGTDKVVEMVLDGCTDAGTATRITETSLKVAWLQPWMWSGVVRPEIGAQLEPGDVVLFDDDVLTMQPARVLPPVVARPDGTYQIGLREYDPAAYSDSTDTTDTVPSLGTTWDTDVVPIHSSIYSVVSGSEVPLVSVDGSGRTVAGNTANPTTVTGTNVRLPNNVPLYGLKVAGSTVGLIKVDASDRTVIGDSSTDIYLDANDQIIIPSGVGICGDWTTKARMLEWRYDATPSANAVILGQGANPTSIVGSSVYISNPIQLANSSAAALNGAQGGITTSEFSSSEWGIGISGGSVYLCYNQSGTIRKVQLT